MRKQPTFVTLLTGFVTAALTVGATGQAQSFSKTFSRTQAQDPGITVQLCQNDMMIVTTPGVVKAVGVTLPGNVEPQFDGTRVILRGNVTSGRTPVAILMRDSDDIYRLHLTGCATRGASTLIKIVDDSPAPTSAKEVTAPAAPTVKVTAPITGSAATLNPAAAAAGLITLPAPTTVQLDVSRTATGVTVTVANGTAQTLALRPEHLSIRAGGQVISAPSDATGNLAPGMSSAFTIAIPADLTAADIEVSWNVQVPALRAQFTSTGSLK